MPTRALGIVGKVITGRLMRLLGQAEEILDMNQHFKEAFDNLVAWTSDVSLLLQLNAPCAFSSVEVKRDSVSQSDRGH